MIKTMTTLVFLGAMAALSAPLWAADAPAGFDIKGLLPLALLGVVFYFLLFRPQQKRAKEQQSMIAALRRGDRIVTQGGLMGTIAKVDGDHEIIVEFAPGVQIRVARSAVSQVLAKTEPAPAKGSDTKDQDDTVKSPVKTATKSAPKAATKAKTSGKKPTPVAKKAESK